MQHQETALQFDLWCGLFCISAACGRATYVARPRAPVYLNLYTILVAEAGTSRKSTSIRCVASILSTLVGTSNVGGDWPIGMVDAKVTPEKLDAILHTRTEEFGSAQLCIIVPELAVFMGTERYIAHMPTLLTDLYDCPDRRFGGGTIERGSVVQHNVWLGFLSASTPTWLLKTVNPNVIEGGFTSRCYFIMSDLPKRRMAWPVDSDPNLLTDLREDVRIICNEAQVRGPIGITEEARSSFTHWYENRQHSLDPFRQSFEAREDAHILRIAALLSINDGSWIIKQEHLEPATELIMGVKDGSSRIFEITNARSKFALGLDVLRTQLITSGMDPVPRHRLYLKCRSHLDNIEFSALIEALQELGAIQRFEYRDGIRGRPTDYIRGTQVLISQGLGERVLERFS
jgi:hypothetical protein